MKFPKFDEVTHLGSYRSGDGEYGIDWDVGQRKYKTIMHGIDVYEHGLVNIRTTGSRNPRWRREAQKHGFTFLKTSELTGMKLYDPVRGTKVSKSEISTSPFFVHHGLKRLYVAYSYNPGRDQRENIRLSATNGITIASEYAQPSVSHQVRYDQVDKKLLAEMHDKFDEYTVFGHALLALNGGETDHLSMRLITKSILTHVTGFQIPEKGSEAGQAFCMDLAKFSSRRDEILKEYSTVVHRTPYLTYEEN